MTLSRFPELHCSKVNSLERREAPGAWCWTSSLPAPCHKRGMHQTELVELCDIVNRFPGSNYHRKRRRPSIAPMAAHRATIAPYQNAMNGIESSGQWNA